MSDEKNVDDDLESDFTRAERKLIREVIDNYSHSRWLFLFTMKIAKWLAAIAAGILAYKQLPGLMK